MDPALKEWRSQGAVYRVQTVMGTGSTATVFKAVREDDKGHSRQTVALKAFRRETSITWMQREFEVLAAQQSPHFVRLLGWENFSSGVALVLEWIEGFTLLELSRRGLLDRELQNEVLAQLQDGVKALKSCDLFHGDISPTNVLVNEKGWVKLIDFSGPPINEDVITGTPAYVAPEIWWGQKPDWRSDLFSVGLIGEDLRDGFQSVPKTKERCLERLEQCMASDKASAMSLAKTSSAKISLGWMVEQPAHRQFLSLQSSVVARSRLGQVVRAELTRMQKTTVQTAIVGGGPSGAHGGGVYQQNLRRVIAWLGFFLISMVAEGGASRFHDAETGKRPAELLITTRHWHLIFLDRHSLGYAPVKLRDLQPGVHELQWQTSSGQYRAQIQLNPGQVLRLNDSGLAAMSKD